MAWAYGINSWSTGRFPTSKLPGLSCTLCIIRSQLGIESSIPLSKKMLILIEGPYREEAHALNLKGKDHLRGLGAVILRKEKVWEYELCVFSILS